MKKIIISYIIIVAVLSCTATFISVRKSDNTTIGTETKIDSLDLGDWNWVDDDSKIKNRKNNNSIRVDTLK